MATIQESLYAALAAAAPVTGLVADRIYPGQIPDDEPAGPWVYYAVPESVPLDQLDADPTDVRSDVEFHAFADRYAQTQAVIAAIMDALNGYRGGVIRRSLWAGTSEEITEDGYHHTIRFTMWWISGG